MINAVGVDRIKKKRKVWKDINENEGIKQP